MYDKYSGRSRRFAFVTMKTVEDANATIEKLNGTVSQNYQTRSSVIWFIVILIRMNSSCFLIIGDRRTADQGKHNRETPVKSGFVTSTSRGIPIR